MNLREAAQQALEALDCAFTPFQLTSMEFNKIGAAIDALRAALSEDAMQRLTDVQQEMEPVAWYDSESGWTDFHSFKPARKPSSPSAEWLPLYTRPQPAAQWVGLTDVQQEKQEIDFIKNWKKHLTKLESEKNLSSDKIMHKKWLEKSIRGWKEFESKMEKTIHEEKGPLGDANKQVEWTDPTLGRLFEPVTKCHELKREWVGLTVEEMRECAQAMDAEPLAEGWKELNKFARAIEAKLKEKNS